MEEMQFDDEHPNIRDRDWRIDAITALAEDWTSPYGVLHIKGEPVQKVGRVTLPNKRAGLGLTLPNPIAMNYSLAMKAQRDATENLQKIEPTLLDDNVTSVPKELHGLFYDALESLIGCVIFSYTTIEVFANFSIPDDYRFERLRSDNRFTEVYTKAQVERQLNLDVKLSGILPNIFNVPSPKGNRLWSEFVRLDNMRDRFIHLKSSDWNGDYQKTFDFQIVIDLLDKKTILSPNVALDVMDYFYKGTLKKPRWFKKITNQRT